MDQKEIFQTTEGNRFFERNRDHLLHLSEAPDHDPVMACIAPLGLSPRQILEIGCSNGWRLHVLKKTYQPGGRVCGIDPSLKAVEEGRLAYPELDLETGTADSLPFEGQSFDMVIFGFCLYLCDRKDLFKIVYEADRVLMDQGHLIVYDFHPPFPYRNRYVHDQRLFSYKMNHAGLFLGNPVYKLKYQKIFPHPPLREGTPDDDVSVVVLEKNAAWAFPDNPFGKEPPPA